MAKGRKKDNILKDTGKGVRRTSIRISEIVAWEEIQDTGNLQKIGMALVRNIIDLWSVLGLDAVQVLLFWNIRFHVWLET